MATLIGGGYGFTRGIVLTLVRLAVALAASAVAVLRYRELVDGDLDGWRYNYAKLALIAAVGVCIIVIVSILASFI